MEKYPMHIVTPKAAIFNKKNKLLIIKRNAKEIAFPNKWTIPGGKLQEGEDVEKGLKREAKEEVNLDVEVVSPLSVFNFVRPDNISVVGIIYLCKAIDEENTKVDGEEHVDFAWINEEDSEKYDFVNQDQLASIFKMLKKQNIQIK